MKAKAKNTSRKMDRIYKINRIRTSKKSCKSC